MARPAYELLTSGSFSGVSTLDIVLTAYTAYRGLKFILTNVTVSVDGVAVSIRSSTDGGANYDAGASDYAWGNWDPLSTITNLLNDAADTQIASTLSDFVIGNAAGEHTELEVTLYNQTSTALRTLFLMTGAFTYTDGACYGPAHIAGARLAAADVNAVRFLPSSGTFSGNYAVYGMV